MSQIVKRPQGRPEKLSRFTEALQQVLDCPHSVGFAIIYTDRDLVEMVNERLAPDERIDMRSFERYKAGEFVSDELLEAFMSAYKKAVRQQQENLFEALRADVPGGWQRYAWILERKFPEWNLTAKSEVKLPDLGRLVLKQKMPQSIGSIGDGSGEVNQS